MNKIFVFSIFVTLLLFIVILPKMVFASDFNYTVNYSKLPFNDSKIFTLLGKENLTVNITYGNFTNGTSFLNFTINQTFLTVYVYVPIYTKPNNYTSIVQIIGDNISYNTNITFNFSIINDTPIINYTEYIQIDVNEFEYTVCDYALPWNTTKPIVVNGYYNQVIQSSYNKRFFNLTDEFTIPIENYTIIGIMIHLDENLTLQRYTERVLFNVVSEFSNVTFHFNIIDCPIPISACNNLFNEMNNVCTKVNKTSSELLECKRVTLVYDKCIYDAMLDASEKRTINVTVVEYVNYTMYKDILSDDPNIISIMRDMILTWNQLRSEMLTLKAKNDEIEKLKGEKDKVWEEANKRVDESLSPLVNENMIKQNTINMYEDKYIKKSSIYWLLFFWLPIIVGFVWLCILIKENYFW